jgi:hypothetical protein
MRADMPKIRHELRSFPKVRSTEPRLAAVLVDVYVEHANLIAERELHSLSYRRWTHHCAHRAITEVVIVGDGVKIVREHDPT